MAEAHPVGFQWVMEAKARGAQIIHVDPRFTRTSAVADTHVPIRPGTDIAFLGGLIRYVLENERDFREYVVAYTNAPMLVREDFVDAGDEDGLFSGWDPETRSYDTSTWQYEGAEVAAASGHRDDWSRVTDTEEAAARRPPAGPVGGRGLGRGDVLGRAPPRRHAAAPAVRLPGAAPPLRPLHPGDGVAGLRDEPGPVPAGRRGDLRELRA